MGRVTKAADLPYAQYAEELRKITEYVKEYQQDEVQSIAKAVGIPQSRVISICEDSYDFVVNIAYRVGNQIAELPKRRWTIEYNPGVWDDDNNVGC